MERETLGQAYAFSFTCLRTSSVHLYFEDFAKLFYVLEVVATGHCCPPALPIPGDNVWNKGQGTCLNFISPGNRSFCYLVTITVLQQDRFFFSVPGFLFQSMCCTKALTWYKEYVYKFWEHRNYYFSSGIMPKAVLSKQLFFKN